MRLRPLSFLRSGGYQKFRISAYTTIIEITQGGKIMSEELGYLILAMSIAAFAIRASIAFLDYLIDRY